MKSLGEIQTEVKRLAAMIAAPEDLLPTYGRSEDFARPHLEVDQRGYHYVVIERGKELSRTTTREFDELMFLVFRDVTSRMGFAYELEHRDETQDSRRIAFACALLLLFRISKEWAFREILRNEELLRDHPRDDLAHLRASYEKELRDKGFSAEGAEMIACDRFPRPDMG